MTGDRRQYDFETKLEIARRHINGESGRALAEEYDLPSPTTVANCTVIYRRDVVNGLRPKRRGRPPTDRGESPDEKRARDTAHGERTTRAGISYLGKITGLQVAGTTGESSSARRPQTHHPLPLVPEDRRLPRSTFYGHRNRLRHRTGTLSSKKPFVGPSKMRRAPTGTHVS